MKSQSLTLAQEFFRDAKQGPTLCIITCKLNNGGCFAFGETLAKQFNNDFIFASTELSIFRENIAKPATCYKMAYITGCCHSDPSFLKTASRKYNFTKVECVFRITTPWDPIYDYNDRKDYYTSLYAASPYIIKLLTSGLISEPDFSIGLPRQLPQPSPQPCTEQKKILEEHTLGIIYIRGLVLKPEETLQAETFLGRYFLQISFLAQEKGISKPSVVILSKEEEIYSTYATLLGVTPLFKDKLPLDQFCTALKEVSEKRGIVATNGVVTFIQANELGCDVLFHGNKTKDFLEMLLTTVPKPCRFAAKEILGLSSTMNSHEYPEEVKEVYTLFRGNIARSTKKFESLMASTAIKTALIHLKSITGVVWKYQSDKHTFFYNGTLSTKIVERLKITNITNKRIPQSTLFPGEDIHIIDNTPDNLKYLEDIAMKAQHPQPCKK